MDNQHSDIARLRKEYARRSICFESSSYYSYYNEANLFRIQRLEFQLIEILKIHSFSDLNNKKILEVGCGTGGVLQNFLKYGAEPVNIYGIDLLYDRLEKSKNHLPISHFINSDGQKLPFKAQSFDVLIQFTAFSSILNSLVKQNMSSEMLRVLKSDGVILWYDFWMNPKNAQTSGIKPKEIKQLFQNSSYFFRKISLAPPIARRIVPISWPLALFFESLKIFNSHYLAIIKKKPS